MTLQTKISIKTTTTIGWGSMMGGSTGIIGTASQQFKVIG